MPVSATARQTSATNDGPTPTNTVQLRTTQRNHIDWSHHS